jgi:hypothetical protein
MLSSDRSASLADHFADRDDHAIGEAFNETGCACKDGAWERAQAFDPDAPWDNGSAEALMRLYESDEGRLSMPAPGERARLPGPQPAHPAPAPEATDAAVDRAWIEAQLNVMVERLQASLAQPNPEPSLAALNGRLEAIEQRFGAALGRVAQRADVDGLRAIETHVLELAAQLEQQRARLDLIGALDEQVRVLVRKLGDAGEERAGGIEKLLREGLAEWREGEQRTAGALHALEDAVNRLSDSLDTIEAAKPAPDLTVPPLPSSDFDAEPGSDLRASLAQVIGGSLAQLPAAEHAPSPPFYHSMLDAADYSPGPTVAAPDRMPAPVPDDAVEWSPEDGAALAKPAWGRLTPGALRIKALRAKLRQSAATGRASSRAAAATESTGALKRASLSLLLMAGAALLAGSTYFLAQAFIAAAPASPVTIEPGMQPTGIKSGLVVPGGAPATDAG